MRRNISDQLNTVKALIIRELMMRYGRQGGGFFWVFIEPMLLCVGITTIWMLIKPGFEKGVVIAALVFTGYMPLTLWRHLTNSSIHLFRANSRLFLHSTISALDLFWARQILEFTATSAAFFIIYIILLALGFVAPIYDWSLCLLSWILMAYLALSASFLFVILTESFEWADKLVQPFQYLLIPISGTFFIVDWLPDSAKALVLLNPLMHVYEIMRAGFIGPGLQTYGNVYFPALTATVILFIGVIGIGRARREVY